MNLSTISLALTRLGWMFSPAALFAAGEQGVWYEPSDLTTLFQDSAGTIPVTAVQQPVGLMLDKSKGLVLGSQLVVSQDLTNAQWAQLPATPVSTTTATTLTFGGQFSGQADAISVSSGKAYLFSFEARRISGNTTLRIYYDSSQQTNGAADFTVDGNWKTVSRVVFATSALVDFGWQDRNASGHGTIELRNISVKELPGNHAFQTTSASRPVLSARYNLLTKTEQFDDAYWAKPNTSVTPNAIAAPNNTLTADLLVEQSSTAGSPYDVRRSGIMAAGAQQTLAVSAAPASRSWLYIECFDTTNRYAYFNLASGSIGSSSGVVASIELQPNGFYLCTIKVTPSALGNITIGAATGNDSRLYAGTVGLPALYLWGADLRVSNDALSQPAYQRVNTATDYDIVGFKPYLAFDGVDDSLVTNSIDFTSTDKMTVFAGVRKLSDAALAVLAELSPNAGTSAGAFWFVAPGIAPGTANYNFRSSGTIPGNTASYTNAAVAAPVTNVLTGAGNIPGDSEILRVNGSQVAATTSDQGTGNYGNYPLFIGRRNNASLPYNGRLYSLIVRGAASTTAQITSTETYVAGKTGVTLA